MKLKNAQLAGLVAIAYVLIFFGGIFVHYLISGEEYTLRYSLALPSVWIAAIAGLITGWGLWNLYRWAWWVGLIGGLYQLFGSLHHMGKFVSISTYPPMGVIVVFGLFVTFLILILLPTTRSQCVKPLLN
jgi:uncharacterized membrane protein (DUF2068 family)